MLSARAALDLDEDEFEELATLIGNQPEMSMADGARDARLRLRIELLSTPGELEDGRGSVVLSEGRGTMAATAELGGTAGRNPMSDWLRLDLAGGLFLRAAVPRALAEAASGTPAPLSWASTVIRFGAGLAESLAAGDRPAQLHLEARGSDHGLELRIWPAAPKLASAVAERLRALGIEARISMSPGHGAAEGPGRILEAALPSPVASR